MFKVKAIYEYTSPHDDDLQFPIGQIITVTEEEDDDWYSGEYTDDVGVHHEGIFPRNFVEKYEPVAPPRPTRTRNKHSEASVISPISPSAAALEAPASPPPPPASFAPASPPSAVSLREAAAAAAEEEPEPERIERVASPVYTPSVAAPASPPKPSAPPIPLSPVAAPAKPADLPISTSPVHKPAPTGPKQGGTPPPVSEKPSSFRDRIAAFNKAAAPPITPFKPSGLGSGSSSNFIKKPFVAPPPSRNAYVPPPREAPATKIYRRDEDPEVKEQEAENIESAEKAGLIPGASAGAAAASGSGANNDDDEPKPMMSLKERLARLQREQQEQAQRHAEAAAKKEKPKRPPKKRLDSHDATAAAATAADEAAGSAPDTSDAGGRHSIDDSHPPRTTHAPRRRASRDPEAQDGNDADMSGAGDTTEGQDEDLTERDDSDEKSRRPVRPIVPIVLPGAAPGAGGHVDEAVEDEEEEAGGKGEETKGEDEGGEAQEEEEEEDIDPEVRRREELRARMAKMSGGMGMMGMQGMQGMFGAPPPPIKKKKASTTSEGRSSEAADDSPSATRAPPVPTMMALPGLAARRSEDKPTAPAEAARPTSPVRAEEQEEEQIPAASPRSPVAQPPPLPGNRPAPPSPPAAPPAVKQVSEGSESDDELSEQTTKNVLETPRPEPTPPPPAAVPTSPTSPAQSTKRMSRIPPPIPGSAPALPPVQTRPPPPPPPGGGINRQSIIEVRSPGSPSQSFQQGAEVPASSDGENEEEVTEYEGDYDTDIANPVPHKNSLKSHARDSSLEDSVSLKSPVSEKMSTFPPPIPGTSRAPPPIPNQPPPPPSQPPYAPSSATADRRRSVDVPRGPPPPPPPPPPPVEETEEQPTYEDENYDPYNYGAAPTSSAAVPIPGYAPPPPQPPPPPSQAFMGVETYTPPDLTLAFAPGSASSSTTTRTHPPGPPPPPPPPSAPGSQAAAGMHSSRATRQSMDMSRGGASGRRSVDVSRPSMAMESGFVANEIDLAPQSGWWLQPNSLPPQLQGRRDIFFESEESQTAKRGGKIAITRDIYVLYMDYSQTVITVRFDPTDASDVQLEQRHEGPPLRLRQDQLEQSYERFGRHIADSVVAKKDTVVGDGTPQGLVLELVRPFRDALLPVGTRAYGALVYSNLANASTTQNDEIRAGDIITLRNARFQGKHGPMHAKYSMEVGKPDHVAVVSEWDGTKKKVRAWEQGRESKKVKLESFKLDDLRSGEVKIWRVMPRSWVGWEGQN